MQASLPSRTTIPRTLFVGNFAAEASDHSEIIRKRLSEIYAELREAVAYCLRAAVKAANAFQELKVSEYADFIVTWLHRRPQTISHCLAQFSIDFRQSLRRMISL